MRSIPPLLRCIPSERVLRIILIQGGNETHSHFGASRTPTCKTLVIFKNARDNPQSNKKIFLDFFDERGYNEG